MTTTKIKETRLTFSFRNRGCIWENRIDYDPNEGHITFEQSDVTSHHGTRFECDNIFTMGDVRNAIAEGKLPQISAMEERQLMRKLGINDFDFIFDDWKEGTWYIDARDIFEDKHEVTSDILDTLVDAIYYVYADFLINGRGHKITIFISGSKPMDLWIDEIVFVKRNTDSIRINNLVLNKEYIMGFKD